MKILPGCRLTYVELGAHLADAGPLGGVRGRGAGRAVSDEGGEESLHVPVNETPSGARDGPCGISDGMDYLARALEAVAAWREAAGPLPSHPALAPDPARFEAALAEFSERMAGSYPFHHPRYAGQMLKPPHPVAIAAYTAAMHVNANNHALDGGPATSALEVEVVRDLATMFGFPDDALGHLTSSGTIANLEALWVARELHPDKAVVYGANAHYTHSRMCAVLGSRDRGAVDSTAGSTSTPSRRCAQRPRRHGRRHRRARPGTGTVDAVERAVTLRERYGVRDPRRRRLRRLLHAARRARPGARPSARSRDCRQRRRRPAQARPAALRVRRGAVPRPGRRAPLQARLAVHLLHLGDLHLGEICARVLARRARPRPRCG